MLAFGLRAVTAASFPGRRMFAAGTVDVAAIGLDGKPVTLRGVGIDD